MIYAAILHERISNARPRSTSKPIGFTPNNVKNAIGELSAMYKLVGGKKMILTMDDILSVVCEFFSMSIERLCEKTRKRDVVKARQIFMHLCRKHTGHSLYEVGTYIGGFDHTTVIHSCETVANLLAVDVEYQQTVKDIEHLLRLKQA